MVFLISLSPNLSTDTGDSNIRSGVLDAEIPLQGRDGDISNEPCNRDQQASGSGVDHVKGRDQRCGQKGQNESGCNAAKKAFPRLVGTDARNDLVTAKQFAPGVLGNVVELGQEQEEQQQAWTAGAVGLGCRQDQEESRVADGEDA